MACLRASADIAAQTGPSRSCAAFLAASAVWSAGLLAKSSDTSTRSGRSADTTPIRSAVLFSTAAGSSPDAEALRLFTTDMRACLMVPRV